MTRQPWKNSGCASCWAAIMNAWSQFAQWLQTQPARLEILARLARRK